MYNTTTTKRAADEVMEDIDASPEELMDTVKSDTDNVYTSTISTGSNYDNEFGINPRNVEIGMIVTLILSLVFALVIFFAITMKKKAPKGKFTGYIREFLNFRKLWVAGIIKFTYIFSALALTIGSIAMIFLVKENVGAVILAALLIIIFGNIILRIIFEMMMVTIGLWENTRDIRKVIVKEEEAPELKKTEPEVIEEEVIEERVEEEKTEE